MFRLFGSKKKEGPPSPEGGGSDHEEREAPEGFTELVPRPPGGQGAEGPPTYSMLQQQLPYQLPSQASTPGKEGRRGSEQHPLAGVHFHLSPRLTQDGEVEYISAAVDSVLARMAATDWTAYDYSFSLEQSVLDNQAALPSVQA